MNNQVLKEIVERGLREDLHYLDLTTDFLISPEARSRARIVFKESGVLCGRQAISAIFETLAPGEMKYHYFSQDGDRIAGGTAIAELEGPTQALLKGERLCLNLLQRLSGIATMSRLYAIAVEGTGARVVDTRKTTPGLRALEKYAVKCGGCFNHRFNLSDGVLIKDNHIQASGGIARAIKKLRNEVGHTVKIEIEVVDLKGLEEAIEAGAEIVMLDNMTPEQVRAAVLSTHGRVVLEASGGVTLETVRSYALTGVDVISSGELTHSVRAMDINMKIIE